VGACLASCATPPTPVVRPSSEASSRRRLDLDVQVARLRDAMLRGLKTTTPNASRYKPSRVGLDGQTPFDGSLDWHSSVIAHWALLVIARTRSDGVLEARLLSRLTPVALERERAVLRSFDPQGPSWLSLAGRRPATFPYDQAWLLLLLAELEKHRQPADSLHAFRIEVQDRLLEWLESKPFPETYALPSKAELSLGWLLEDDVHATDPAFIGAYGSWIFTWLAVALSGPIGPEAAARLEELRRERIKPSKQALLGFRAWNPQDFFWLPALLAIVDVVSEEGVVPAWYQPGLLQALPRSVSRRTAHSMGVEVSKLWGLAVRADCGDEGARQVFEARFLQIMNRPDLWAEDFWATGHWIPQYLWFALWLAEGRP